MNSARKKSLYIILFVMSVLALASGLILYALRQNISLFYTPTQIAAGEAPISKSIRIGGMVEKGSIKRSKEGLEVSFVITDFKQSIRLLYQGVLPDLFREGQGVVAEGQLIDKDHFIASQVLAKHDEKYMPPEVKAALAQKDS